MALEDFLISTGVDALINLVRKKGKIGVEQAARELEMPVSTIEDWAKTLEAEGLVKIDYNLTKEVLVWKGLNAQEYTEKMSDIDNRKREAIQKLDDLKNTVDQNVGQIDKLDKQFEEAKVANDKELAALVGDYSEASRLIEQAQETISRKKEAIGSLAEELEKAKIELGSFKKLMDEANTHKGKKTDADKLAKELDSAASKLESMIQSNSAEFENMKTKIEKLRLKFDDDRSMQEIGALKEEIEDVKFARNELLKSAKALLSEVKDMGEKAESLEARLKTVEESRMGKANPERMREEIEQLHQKATKDSETIMYQMQNNFMSVKKSIHDYSQAIYQYENIKAHLNSLQNQYNGESAELGRMLGTLEVAQKKYVEDLKKAKESLGGRKAQYEDLIEKAKRVEMILGNIQSLKAEGNKLSTRLKGLVMETQVVDSAAAGVQAQSRAQNAGNAKASTVDTSGYEGLPPELVQKIKLTEAEEAEFEKKREELRWLIHKMSKEDRSEAAGA